jgi:single-strand DNA-binding protein
MESRERLCYADLLTGQQVDDTTRPSAVNTMPGALANFVGGRIFRFMEVRMNNLNSVLIEGNMVRDPLTRSTQKGMPVCHFSIASNRYYRQDSNFEKETGFFDVEAWGRLIDTCVSQGHKGRGVRVVGRLRQGRWVGDDGKNHSKVCIVAEHVEYRADFKKADVPSSEVESVAEAAAWDEKAETGRSQYEFPTVPPKGVPVEEFAVSF